MSLILDKNDKSYLNLDRERNEQNMNALDYNCGRYALGTFTWILLDSFNHGEDLEFETNETDDEMMEDIELYVDDLEEECIKELVEDFEGLVRPISVLSELHEDEYAVLFRVSYDGEGYIDDFHFVKDTTMDIILINLVVRLLLNLKATRLMGLGQAVG